MDIYYLEVDNIKVKSFSKFELALVLAKTYVKIKYLKIIIYIILPP